MLFALLSVVAPCVVVTVGLLLIDRRFRREGEAREREAGIDIPGIAAAATVALGYLIGHALLVGWPKIPPFEAQNWIPWMAVLAAVLFGSLAERTMSLPAISEKRTRPTRRIVGLVFAAGLSFVLVRPLVLNTWTIAESLIYGSVPVVCWIAFEMTLDRLRREVPGAVFTGVAATSMAVMAPLFIFSASAVLGQLAGIAVSALAPAFILALRKRSALRLSALPAVVATIWIALSATAYFYAELPLLSLGLVVIGPALARWVGAALRDRQPLLRGLAVVFAAILPILIALVVAWSHYEPNPYATYDDRLPGVTEKASV